MNRNNAVLGLLLGIIFPFLGVLLIYVVKFTDGSLSNFLHLLFQESKIGSMVFSLGLIANLIPFLYFTNRRLDHAARGILIATMLYAILIVMLRFELYK
jgi:amino acid permease